MEDGKFLNLLKEQLAFFENGWLWLHVQKLLAAHIIDPGFLSVPECRTGGQNASLQ